MRCFKELFEAGAQGIDTKLPSQLTRHRSEFSFAQYSNRALEIQAQEQFYAMFGKEGAERHI